jgi:hypothetical protein
MVWPAEAVKVKFAGPKPDDNVMSVNTTVPLTETETAPPFQPSPYVSVS